MTTIEMVGRGLRGLTGAASGPLGAGSVEAVHITDDSAKQAAIRTKLGITGSGTFGSTAAQGIDTSLAGTPVPADIGQIYIGNTVASADAITIDSGNNFPGGIAFRRCLGTLAAPSVVTPGTQLGYNDFRGYNDDGLGGAFFYNSGSLDVVVEGNIGWGAGDTPPSIMRFAVCNDPTIGAELGMILQPSGTDQFGLYINHIYGGEFGNNPTGSSEPVLHVVSRNQDWTSNVEGQNDALNFGSRIVLKTETVDDYFLFGLSGASGGTGKFAFRGNGKASIGTAAAPVGTLDVDGPVRVKSYTVATVPNGNTSAQIIFVSNEAGGATLAYSDEGTWRRVADRAAIS